MGHALRSACWAARSFVILSPAARSVGLSPFLGWGDDFPSPPFRLDAQAQDLVSIKI